MLKNPEQSLERTPEEGIVAHVRETVGNVLPKAARIAIFSVLAYATTLGVNLGSDWINDNVLDPPAAVAKADPNDCRASARKYVIDGQEFVSVKDVVKCQERKKMKGTPVAEANTP